VKRRTPFRTGFGEHDASRWEIKRCEVPFGIERKARFLPMEPTGDHEMKDQPVVVCEPDGDAFSDSSNFSYRLVLEKLPIGHNGPQQKGMCDADLVQQLAQDPLLKGFDIDDYVRQFRHAVSRSLAGRCQMGSSTRMPNVSFSARW
jgi:hypothetical protein